MLELVALCHGKFVDLRVCHKEATSARFYLFDFLITVQMFYPADGIKLFRPISLTNDECALQNHLYSFNLVVHI